MEFCLIEFAPLLAPYKDVRFAPVIHPLHKHVSEQA